eukprot:6175292-Pleurochrysis_carterae.AAC.2
MLRWVSGARRGRSCLGRARVGSETWRWRETGRENREKAGKMEGVAAASKRSAVPEGLSLIREKAAAGSP